MSSNEMPSHHGSGEIPEKRTFPNETIQLLIERSSCRSYEDKPITKNVLDLVLEAGIHSPTGGNLQPYSIIKIEDRQTNRRLAELSDQKFVGTAAVNLLFCLDWRRLERWAKLEVAPFTATSSFRHFWISFQDTIINAQNICTAADALGLGSCYIGTVTDFFGELKEMFELPNGVFPIVLLCLGYPKKRPQSRKKLGIASIVHDEKYHELSDNDLLAVFNKKYPFTIEPTDDRIEKIRSVCINCHGEEFATKCLDRIKTDGTINPAQRYFGLHYMADGAEAINKEFAKRTEEFGFSWFKEFLNRKG